MRTHLWLPAVCIALTAARALAENTPESALELARKEYLAKVNYACEVSLSIDYDHASLREHDAHIEHGQLDGSAECNEPLRYLWYACQTKPGKAAVQAARIERILCRGTPNAIGALTLDAGTLTLERSAQDPRLVDRVRRRFEAIVHVALKLPGDRKSPSTDRAWSELRYAPNPTRSTTDYCIADGNKQEFSPYIVTQYDSGDATLECLKNGEKVVELEVRDGRKTGFYTQFDDRGDTIFSYRDNKLDGETKTFRGGRLASVVMYKYGDIAWSKEFHPSGKVKEYSRKLARGWAKFSRGEDGRVYALECSPEVGDDMQLRELCGFFEELTTPIYDGSEKVNRYVTYRNGVLTKQRAGDSPNAERSSVGYANGKKHGLERIFAEDGTLASTIQWNHGVKEGKELQYAKGGVKVVKEIVWRVGEASQVTEYFLNGNPKSQETYLNPKRKQLRRFWDTGNLARQGAMVSCASYGARSWCEDGLHRSYFEDGKPEAEATFKLGVRHGPSRSWWPNGKPASVEEFVDGRRVKSRRWDQSGHLTVDEEYEADGSRKIKR